jgi:hypothetical protein
MNDDGFGLVSALEQNTTANSRLQTTISVSEKLYGVGEVFEHRRIAGKSSSRRIQQRVSLESTLPLLLEGFRKNTNGEGRR